MIAEEQIIQFMLKNKERKFIYLMKGDFMKGERERERERKRERERREREEEEEEEKEKEEQRENKINKIFCTYILSRQYLRQCS